jgi:hypothetical protein
LNLSHSLPEGWSKFLNILYLFFLFKGTGYGASIVLATNDWGKAHPSEVISLLEDVTNIVHLNDHSFDSLTIQVGRTKASPITFYQPNIIGDTVVHLNTKDRHWCQYAFQFAHEIGHIICRTAHGNQSNQWFEESLCEALSLYTLKELSELWAAKGSRPRQLAYASEFLTYKKNRILNSFCPENFQLSSWWKENKSALMRNPYLRKQNIWIAIQLVAFIDKSPQTAFSSIRWLNHASHDTENILFEQYITAWKNSCPKDVQKTFVEGIMTLFGL